MPSPPQPTPTLSETSLPLIITVPPSIPPPPHVRALEVLFVIVVLAIDTGPVVTTSSPAPSCDELPSNVHPDSVIGEALDTTASPEAPAGLELSRNVTRSTVQPPAASSTSTPPPVDPNGF